MEQFEKDCLRKDFLKTRQSWIYFKMWRAASLDSQRERKSGIRER